MRRGSLLLPLNIVLALIVDVALLLTPVLLPPKAGTNPQLLILMPVIGVLCIVASIGGTVYVLLRRRRKLLSHRGHYGASVDELPFVSASFVEPSVSSDSSNPRRPSRSYKWSIIASSLLVLSMTLIVLATLGSALSIVGVVIGVLSLGMLITAIVQYRSHRGR